MHDLPVSYRRVAGELRASLSTAHQPRQNHNHSRRLQATYKVSHDPGRFISIRRKAIPL